MILRSVELGEQSTAIELAALLGERDLLRFPAGERNVDFRLRLDALHDPRHAPPSAQVDSATRQRVKRAADQLHRQLKLRAHERSTADAHIGRLLALAYPDRIAQSRGGDGRYLLSNGRGAQLPPAQSLGQCQFLVVADLDAGARDALIRLAAPIEREIVEAEFAASIEERERIEWDSREQAVIARRERSLGALSLTQSRLDRPDPERIADALIAGIRELGLDALPWTKESRQLQARLSFARACDTREPNPWPDVSDATLFATLEEWLKPWIANMTRREHLARL